MTTTKKVAKESAPKGKGDDVKPTSLRRDYEMLVVMGPPAHGKTTFVDELAKQYATGPRKGKVWVVDPNEAWVGVPYVTAVWPEGGVRGRDGKGALDDLLASFETNGPGMLILDDADKYARHATEVIDDLMTSFRHWKKDVVVVSRRPAGIPKDAIANANALALFAVREVNSRKYLTEQFGGPEVVDEVPREPYRYLYVRQDAYFSRAVYSTAPRATVAKADREGAQVRPAKLSYRPDRAAWSSDDE
jgi:hypothetical protein